MMDSTNLLNYIMTGILGGGLFKGITVLWRAITEAREKKQLGEQIGAKTPAEIESISVATMNTALQSAQRQIEALQAERKSDQEYYQGRIKELSDQLATVRGELADMEKRLSALLEETEQDSDRRP